MAKRKHAPVEKLFKKYENGIVVESIDFNCDKGSFYRLNFAPAAISLIIPDGMIEDYNKIMKTKSKSKYPDANSFLKETGILEKLRKSNVKVINKNWNTLGDVLDCLKRGFYSGRFQPIESKNVRLEIEEIPTYGASAM